MEGIIQARGHGVEEPLVEEAAMEMPRQGAAQNDHGPEEEDEDDHSEEGEEEEEEEEEVQEANPRMRLTEEERDWALAIKEAMVGNPELDNQTDYFYAQLALVDKENVQAAVDRAQKIQYFRQEYGVVDTTQVAMKYIEDYLNLFPGNFLSFSWIQDHGSYVMVVDLSKLDGGVFRQKPGAFATLMVASYFMGPIMSPDLEAVRRGVFILAECEGFSWSKNFGIDFFRQANSEITFVYPMNFEGIKYFHTGLVFNLLISMSKQFLPPEVHSKLQVGCVCEYGRLDNLYLIPSLEAANQRFMKMAQACLDKYYMNAASFSLD